MTTRNILLWIGVALVLAIVLIIIRVKTRSKRKTQAVLSSVSASEPATGESDLTVVSVDVDTEVSERRKKRIRRLGDKLYDDIYDTPLTGHTYSYYEKANDLDDNELLFLARYYIGITKGSSLFEDVDDEAFSLFSDVDTKLMNHLAIIGEGE